ncbi:MAG: DUF11 domain-containing protein [Verrucomicrobia bacterium]|nr:DUF11 domain-containing protein [Verrucomicrobiota bacterium]
MRNWAKWVVCCWMWILGGGTLLGQSDSFGIRFGAVPDPAFARSDVSFTLAVTNLTFLIVNDVQVTVLLQGAGTFRSAEIANGFATNSISFNGETNTVIFFLNFLTNSGVATMRYTFRPTSFGEITQTVFVQTINTPTQSTNYVTAVRAGRADLTVGIQAVPVGSLAGDLVAYTLAVTNSGPDLAADVRLTNTLPAGLSLLGVDPGFPFNQRGSEVVVRLGALATNQGTAAQLRVQPQVSGALRLQASVGAPGYDNPAGSNRQASATMTVATPGPGVLTASLVSAQQFNPQTGLMQQRVRVRNVGGTGVSATRVLVSGLTNTLANAQGTNGTTPFVTLSSPLGAGGAEDLWLMIFNPSRVPGGNPAVSALDVPLPGPLRPYGTNVAVGYPQTKSDGTVWIEFPTTPGRQYAVLYGNDVQLLSGIALPVVVAPANRLQWIDSGPPLTSSSPTNAASRMYQVIELTWP